jgi:hypothetical protein
MSTLEQLLEINPALPAGDDVGSRRGQRKRDGDLKQVGLDQLVFLRGMLASPAGRRWLWNLLAGRLHAFNTDFPAAGEHAAWYQRGKQDAGLALYHDLVAIDRDGILAMHDEYDPRFRKADA